MFSKHMEKIVMHDVLFALKIFMGPLSFVAKCPYARKLSSHKIRKISSLVDFHGLHQILHS